MLAIFFFLKRFLPRSTYLLCLFFKEPLSLSSSLKSCSWIESRLNWHSMRSLTLSGKTDGEKSFQHKLTAAFAEIMCSSHQQLGSHYGVIWLHVIFHICQLNQRFKCKSNTSWRELWVNKWSTIRHAYIFFPFCVRQNVDPVLFMICKRKLQPSSSEQQS